MAPHIDRILALLPFEPAALERLHGPETIYVGHPLIERLAELRPDAEEAAHPGRCGCSARCWSCPAAAARRSTI